MIDPGISRATQQSDTLSELNMSLQWKQLKNNPLYGELMIV